MSKLKKISQKIYNIRMDDTYLERLFAVQNDTASRAYLFKFSDTSGLVIDVTGLELEFTLQIGDKKQTAAGTIVDAAEGLFEVTLTSSMLQIAGVASGQLMLIDNANNAKLQNLQFEIHIAPSLEFGGEGEEGQDLWFTFQMLRDAIETTETLESNYRTSLDEQEVLHAEVVEKHAETVAMHAALEPVFESENARVAAEQARATAETARAIAEEERDTAETARKEAETDRQGKEAARQSAEAGRVSAENTRVSNETARVNAENARATAENSRASEETKRRNDEVTRQDAEIVREQNEATRVSTQNARDTTWQAWQELMEEQTLPPATPTVAGVVKIDKENEDTAISVGTHNADKSTLEQQISGVSSSLTESVSTINQSISTLSQNTNTSLANKVDKVDGKGLSENDFTNALKNKLDGIATNANNYSHPSSHSISMITETADKKIMTKDEREKLEIAITTHGTNVIANIAVINSGGSTSGIPENTIILELE